MNRALAGVVCIGLFGCSPASHSSLESTSAPIQGGEPDTGNPAVGLVWESGGYCTGTLIAPDVVLTAAHCISPTVEGFYTGAGSTQVDASGLPKNVTRHGVDQRLANPGYSSNGGCPNSTVDLGLLHLDTPITDIAPVALGAAAPAAGSVCEAVGFGWHQEDGGTLVRKVKFHGTEQVQAVTDMTVTVGTGNAIADHGDSGGPLLCGGAIAGATSCHVDGDWPSHKVEYYGRVDNQVAWVQSVEAAWHSDGGQVSSDGGMGGSDGGVARRDGGVSRADGGR